MLTEDYLMRIINQALAVLMTAVGLRKAGKYSDALQAIEQAVQQLTLLPANLIDQMDETSLLSTLTTQGQLDVGRLAILADLVQEQGEIFSSWSRAAQADLSFARALRLHLEAVLADAAGLTTENMGKIEYLYRRLKDRDLPVDTWLALSDYYQRLLSIDEQVLLKNGIDHKHIRETLAGLDRRLNAS